MTVPDYVLEHVALRLSTYTRYREEIARSRELGRRLGGGRRYVDDARRNLRRELLQAAGSLREFTQLAKRNGVDPSQAMRDLRGTSR